MCFNATADSTCMHASPNKIRSRASLHFEPLDTFPTGAKSHEKQRIKLAAPGQQYPYCRCEKLQEGASHHYQAFLSHFVPVPADPDFLMVGNGGFVEAPPSTGLGSRLEERHGLQQRLSPLLQT